MNQVAKNSLIIFCGMLCSCHSVPRTATGKPEMPAMINYRAVPATRSPTSAGGPGWAPRLYAVRACGSFNAITNTPESKALFEGMLKEMGVPGTVRLAI